ncbi:hypothetical protein CBR20_15870 [Cronobacter sakazakii]|nr:hypothetical protein [Cronobacter sakazakii]KAB0805884.1 hypothetical protein FZI15_21325 [Cronobacter sakazakii]KAB0818958.1 hypothetical protein FZI44_18940 [Cronobacter sakazakii]KAB1054271.1 hypothetical protein AUM54_13435 [Cronobacter sakazakii]KAB1486067.1 hypothetical protein FZI16_14575 [Cronobacter sakazakii]
MVALFDFSDERWHIDVINRLAFADLFHHHLERLAFPGCDSSGAGCERSHGQAVLFVGKDGVLTDGVAAIRVLPLNFYFRTAQRVAIVSGDRGDFRKVCF